MIPNNPELSGSIILERGTHFISKQIILHMAIYAKMTGRKPLKYSHAETLIWDSVSQQLYTVGARADGLEMSRVSDYYTDQDILVLKPKTQITNTQNGLLWAYWYTGGKSKYQTGNFLSWITYLKSGWWFSKKGNQRMYCYEACARFASVIGRWPDGKSLDMVSIYDLFECENYEIYTP